MTSSRKNSRNVNGVTPIKSAEEADFRRSSGLLFFLLALVILGVFSGITFEQKADMFQAGEVAADDVSADRELLVVDVDSTARKRSLAAENQPPVFDLNPETYTGLETQVAGALLTAAMDQGENPSGVRRELEDQLDVVIGRDILDIWQDRDFHALMYGRVLPWLKNHLNRGVVADRLMLQPYRKNGMVIRDPVAGTENRLPDPVDIYDVETLIEQLDEHLKQEFDVPLRTRKAVQTLVAPLVRPSLRHNPEASRARALEASKAVEPVYYQIKKGEIIVRQGERVTQEQQRQLEALQARNPGYFHVSKAASMLILGLFMSLGLYFKWTGQDIRQRSLSSRDFCFLAAVMLVFGIASKLVGFVEIPLAEEISGISPEFFSYAIPLAGGVGVLALYFAPEIVVMADLILAFLCTKMLGGNLDLFIYYFLSGVVYMILVKRAQSRIELLKTVFPLVGGMLIIWLGVSLFKFQGLGQVGVGGAFVAFAALLSLLTVLSLSPIAEYIFGYSSNLRLLELMNLEQPLFQELMVGAPGTYHHSLVVANMVEAASRVVGANPLLAKVAALYHDIGKLAKPHYFIENQFGGKNPHDKLAPSMSTLIVTSHVKKGVELARENKLGQEICDIIRQHHGTRLVQAFYRKAREQAESRGEQAREEEFRYPGPKPQTKEAGLILLADAIEASSRTLVEPTTSRLRGHINSMIKDIFNEGQLDESELPLKDLHRVGEVFQHILTGIFHRRISYPSQQEKPETPAGERTLTVVSAKGNTK